MSKVDRILTFYHVVEEGSFLGAAKKLSISNAAVSKQIAQLERELGLQLINRSNRKLSLTQPGEVYFELSKALKGTVREMDSFAAEMQGEPMGHLNVTSQRQFGEECIVPNLSDFLAQHPKLRLNLELNETLPDLEKEGIDVLIGMSVPSSLNEIHKKIGTTRYVMCASPQYLQEYGTPKTPKELLNHRYINHVLRQPNDRIRFKEDQEIILEPYLLLNDTRAMREAAIQGLGIVKLHAYVVKEALQREELVEILNRFSEPLQPIYVSYRAQKFVPPKIRCFIDYFVEKFQSRNRAKGVEESHRGK